MTSLLTPPLTSPLFHELAAVSLVLLNPSAALTPAPLAAARCGVTGRMHRQPGADAVQHNNQLL